MKISIKLRHSYKKLLLIIPAFVILFNTGLVQALSADDLNSIYNDTVWYDPSGSSSTESCTLNTTAPGSGAPDGAQFPNLDPATMASAIDTWINQENSQSELKGLGATIVASAKASNVNPFLIIAISHEESNLADPSDYNIIHGNNGFGRSAAPGQPSFQGDRAWYKWSSVKASIDSTAPENQNASGGGDMATYLRNQYGGQLDSNNLTAMILQYAPPKENDTQKYIANVQSWIDSLVKLSNGQPADNNDTSSSTSVCGGSSSCTGTTITGNAAILCEAQKYSGIYYLFGGAHESYAAFRQICPVEAVASAAAASTAADPGPCATDCSGLVSVAVDAAFNLNYVWSVAGAMVGDGSQNWQSISVGQAQAGDIVTTSEHVEIVDHVQGNTVYTFGSHHTGSKTGPISTSTSYWSGAYHWTGPGSSG